MTTRHEYRVSWRRSIWKQGHPQSRTFSRRHDAVRFFDKLAGGGRPDLAPLDVLRLDVRTVGAWREAAL